MSKFIQKKKVMSLGTSPIPYYVLTFPKFLLSHQKYHNYSALIFLLKQYFKQSNGLSMLSYNLFPVSDSVFLIYNLILKVIDDMSISWHSGFICHLCHSSNAWFGLQSQLINWDLNKSLNFPEPQFPQWEIFFNMATDVIHIISDGKMYQYYLLDVESPLDSLSS